jgi:DNA polymerase-3 subunit alpha
MRRYVNLYQHSEYTMLGCTIKIECLVAAAAAAGYEALAIADFNNMHGALKFYHACRKARIKPIIGLCVACDSDDNFQNRLLLYAIGDFGYKNLLVIASRAKTKGSVDLEFLRKHDFDLIAVLPGEESEIVKLYREGAETKALERLSAYRKVFPDLYLGLDLQSAYARENIGRLIAFAQAAGVKSVALHKTLYLEPADFTAYQVLRAIDANVNEYPFTEKEANGRFISPEEAEKMFKAYSDLLTATLEIADRCRLEIKSSGFRLPVFPDARGESFRYLSELSKIGLNKRLQGRKADVKKYRERLLYELDVINKMGFCDYFLIVYDFVRYAKKNDILVGPGRGSAPGSLVSYALGITDIDPVEHDLLFERFLNPERITMPDIDIDFPDNKRDQVIRYVMEKYGVNRVAHISTFGTFGVRLAIRDVARVRKFSEAELSEVLKHVPAYGSAIDTILVDNEMLRTMAESNPRIGELIDVVRKIEGLPRHISTHAAGIIMADDELINYTALQPGINGLYQTQYEADDLSAIGLVKFDFLGLKNLTIIDETIEAIRREEPGFNLGKIPLDDVETYRMIARGDTDGIFQLESEGMRKTLAGLRASSFIDIVHANALYRPGPMEMIPSFIRRKFGEEPVDYLHPALKEILAPTYGTIVFQEQIMMIARVFAGYTLGMADILRRAVSKKDARVLEAERERFVKSSTSRGYSAELGNKIYDYIVRFANYGFNKSHAVAYSLIAYQMAYLKRRYYRYFMAVLMSHSVGSVTAITNYVSDCRKKKIKVYPPSINKSEDRFVVRDGGIYYSLLGIQNVGGVTVRNLLEEREKNGPYRSFHDFVARTAQIINRRVVEYLIWAGALDDFSLPRKQMAEQYESALDFVKYRPLFAEEELITQEYGREEYSFEELTAKEREALGLNLKYSIFTRYANIIARHRLPALSALPIGNAGAVFAVQNIKRIMTKNNAEMAFLQIYDDSGKMDAVLFPETYRRFKNILTEGGIYLGRGKTEIRNNRKQLIINHIETLNKG